PIREWKKRDGDRNEALDCRVYSMAALQGLVAMGLMLNKEAERILEIPLKEPTPGMEEKPARSFMPKAKRRIYHSPWMG
ncbi:MAG: phage terminase large subunit family protein, partial [Magnetococcales bacterium]|nr:phage terminase large subunit family protein [Magnetococcales bacterium]